MIKHLNKKKLLIQSLFHLIGLIILGIVSIVATITLQASVQLEGFNWELGSAYFQTHPFVLGASSLFIFLVGILLSLIFGSIYIGTGLASIIFFGFAYATTLKMESRNEPIYPNELGMIRNIKELISMVDTKQVVLVLAGMAILILLLVAIHIFGKRLLKLKRQGWRSYVIRLALMVPVLFALGQYYFLQSKPTIIAAELNKRNLKNLSFNQAQSYETNGFIFGFLMNATFEKPEAPEGYSKAAIEKIVQKYNKQAEQTNKSAKALPKKVNINLVLNESLTDINFPDIQEYFKLNKNPLEFVTSLRSNDNAIVKTMVSDRYGGGTADIEYEVLTGMSNYFLNPTTSPYQNIVPQFSEYPSLATDLKNNKLKTTALHSYNANMYKRYSNYPKLGIDKFITLEQMKKLKFNPYGAYTTDKSLYKYVYQNWADNKNNSSGQFNFTLTMQNHLPYRDSWSAAVLEAAKHKPIIIEGRQKFIDEGYEKYNYSPLRNYVNSLRLSDEGIKDMYEHVMKQKEPTVVAIFGDHRPGTIIDFLRDKDPIAGYSTPVIYFANFKLKDNGIDTISANNVLPNLYDQANFKRSGWIEFLLTLQKQLPILTHQAVADGNKKIVKTEDVKNNKLVRDYELLNYDQNFGKQYAEKAQFFQSKQK